MSAAGSITVFGTLEPMAEQRVRELVDAIAGSLVQRLSSARSSTPFPKSTDLEAAIAPLLLGAGFRHHHRLAHPKTGEGFEYDFWRADDGLAVEVMGYRADDEIYKDILKFHVHEDTRVGVVLVPRWKWISGRRTETNYKATMKALAFADSYMAAARAALVAVVYDWALALAMVCGDCGLGEQVVE
ncbi:MAG: hypothetical protein H6704_30920 [Myxococcales bacterium]|nr:hypothetical protein [Myxococcales bacterium]